MSRYTLKVWDNDTKKVLKAFRGFKSHEEAERLFHMSQDGELSPRYRIIIEKERAKPWRM